MRAKKRARSRRREAEKKVGASPQACTYELGHVRQNVYACMLCSGGQLAGFCEGCKTVCHGSHLESVVDLYSKRAFRCDCGNAAMANKCCLEPAKDARNLRNDAVYNHNFAGKYCRCDRRYDLRLGDMVQCAMCEDWFHEGCFCLPGRVKKVAKIALKGIAFELTCRECVAKLPALAEYYETDGVHLHAKSEKHAQKARAVMERPRCARPSVLEGSAPVAPQDFDYLWVPGFRSKLCRCHNCMAMYKTSNAEYIVDRGDYIGAAQQEDTALLKATDDAEIIQDVLDAEEAEQQSSRETKRTKRSRRHSPEPDLAPAQRIASTAAAFPRGVSECAVAEASPASNDPTMPEVADSTVEIGDARVAGDNANVNDSTAMDGVIVSTKDRQGIRSRIIGFLQNNIQTNGRSMTRDGIRDYLADLKADIMGTLTGRPASS